MSAAVGFLKVEGLGNDFLLLDQTAASPAALAQLLGELRAAAPRLCHRRRGVGADGLLVLGPPTSPGGHAHMHIINHDGSVPEMCGNGLRCAALHLARGSDAARREILVDTDAGPRLCVVTDMDGATGWVRAQMGPARLGEPAPIDTEGVTRTFHRVNLGNPHAVCLCDPGEDPKALAHQLGPRIERHEAFPQGTNVEFARLHDEAPSGGSLTLWVWERGCGVTAACGTGACAAAAVATRVTGVGTWDVALPGGHLRIDVPHDTSAPLHMTGPARIVFTGAVPAP